MTAPSLFSCEGQVALVTGAATGIGLACARALGQAGARVAIAGLGDIDEAVDGLKAEGLDIVGTSCDVTEPAQLAELVARIRRDMGRLDTILANAGAALDDPNSPEPLLVLDRMYALHVRSVTALAHLTLPFMAETNGGSFLIMSSIAGLRGNRLLGGYGVTKAANAEIARNIAVQWGSQNIRANAISPGVINTEFARPITAAPEIAEARLAKTPLGRFGQPQEVAGTVVWLASPAGAFVSGQNIIVDGGTLIAD